MADEQDTVEVEEVAKEARESFSLIDRIKNRDMRTVKLDLGYDEVGSEKLTLIEASMGAYRNVLERGDVNLAKLAEYKKLRTSLRREVKTANPERTADVKDELADVEQKIESLTVLEAEMLSLREKEEGLAAEVDKIREAVRANSLSVELRALPYAIARGSARRAKVALDITGKGIPEELTEAFQEQQLVEIAYDQVVRFRDNATGEEGTKLPMDVILAMRDFLPLTQSAKFFNTVNDLQYRNAISESVIQQADF